MNEILECTFLNAENHLVKLGKKQPTKIKQKERQEAEVKALKENEES